MGKRPNVVIIVTDDQGYGDIRANGNPWINTPNFDWMHDNGVCLEDYHTDPLCAPARSALMSGRYSFGAGVYSTLNGRYFMKPDIKTMADYFKEGGYRTGMFGKWHLGDTYPYHPENRGFDDVLSFGGGVIGETPDYWNNNYYDDVYRVNGKDTEFKGYCTDIWFERATKFMDDSIEEDKPFFCYLPTNAPHGPLNIDETYYKKYLGMNLSESRARFYGMIECIDENIGRLFKHLQEKDAFKDTIFIYFGDNGSAGGCEVDKDSFVINGYNAGMRGKKGTTYEGAHKNACFVVGPKEYIGTPRKVHGITAHMDWLPTLIDICGLEKGTKLDGISMASQLKDDSTNVNKDRTLVVHNMQRDMPQKYKDYSVLKNNMRLVRPLTNETNPFLLGSFSSSADVNPEIYDISKDPEERNDCYEEYKDLAIELTNYYEEWYDERLEEAMKYSPIYLTKDHPVKLTCHAWHECTKMCFSQKNVRDGINGNGYFSLTIEDEGDYEFELRRYPREANLGLDASCEAIEKDEKLAERWAEGKIYNIKKADIRVAGLKLESDVLKGQKQVTFKIHLKKGDTHLRTRFFLEDNRTIGAYYVYIKYIEA